MKIELLAAIFTVIGGALTVIYSEGDFGAWDLVIGGFVFYVCCAYKSELSKDKRTLIISRIGISIAIMIILMTILTAIYKPLARAVMQFQVNIFGGTLLLTIILFLLSFLFYRSTQE